MNSLIIVCAAMLAVAHGGLIGLDPLGLGLGLGLGGRTAIISGPTAGVVSVSGHGLIAPGILGHGGLLGAAPLLASNIGVLGAGRSIVSIPRGQGIEGAWIPDINEKLYDDGSYRGLH